MVGTFREVFSNRGIREQLLRLFEDVTVERIVHKKSVQQVKIFISYDRMLDKESIYEMEDELEKSIFQSCNMSCRIIENYRLDPERYDATYVVREYGKSLLMELERREKLIYTALRYASYQVDNGNIVVKIPDSFVARTNEEHIREILEDVYQSRFHLPEEIRIEYEEHRESRYLKASEIEDQQRIEAISAELIAKTAAAVEHTEESEELMETAREEMLPEESAEKKETTEKKEKTDKTEPKEKTEKSAAKEKKAAPAKSGGASEGTSGGGYNGKSYGKKWKGKGKDGTRPLKQSDNPMVLYGRDFENESVLIDQLVETFDAVTITGQILDIETKVFGKDDEAKSVMVKITVTDYSDSIRVKLFVPEAQSQEFLDSLKKDDFIKVRGTLENDRYDHELELFRIFGIKKAADPREHREDYAGRKRVELHCHTLMSDMDGCVSPAALIKRAKKFGHTALALTDHGNIQAHADAAHSLEKGDSFKLLYGVEAYLVDDTKKIVVNEKGQTLSDSYVVFDIETTGFVPKYNKIIEIGAVKVTNGEIVDRFSEFINPEEPIPLKIEKLTSITDSMVADAGIIDEVLPRFLDFCQGCVLVAHNAKFDTSYIRYYAEQLGLTYDFTHTDTIELARFLMARLGNYKLDHLAKELNIPQFHHHRAVDDAEATALIFLKLIDMLRERKIETLAQLNEVATLTADKIADLYPHHAVILAKNEVGRRNLYKLISQSHLETFSRTPKIPKSRLNRYREGLILGSGCSSGELYQAIINERSEEEIVSIINYYDYLEIQPIGNNEYMLDGSELPNLTTREDLIRVNKRIVSYGELYRKPVCATGDVHYLDPEDSISRTIITSFRKMDKVRNLSDTMYFHTTEEMLEEFSYLGVDKATEVVIENTNKIADMCERISPVRPDKCPPVIADSDKTLRTICYTKAHDMYGEQLPPIVEERLERELKSIIGNGFAVMYIIAQKLVWKSVEDGYLVGSRGSVGSSFAATMAGITEVNPLAPHYYCPKCHYSDFDSEIVRESKEKGLAGCDMPDQICPKCGEKLNKDGFDIPFETFLGFKGDKEPDIDLNFSSEYQPKAHKYTEVIFGAGQTFRAGTVGTVKEKTALSYVRTFYKERGIEKREAELKRVAKGIEGIRRTTGQHPGGIIVLPVGEDIDSFTPMQHPANKMTSDIVTTHFDYHKIDHNLLKLDILGHDDPTMLRMLQDITGLDPTHIPLDDKKVMSLFHNTEALGVTPEELGGIKLGVLGIPEFGTGFAMQMVREAKPQSFSDLERISGLSHGENLWLGNAQDLIQSGIATISTAICTRDDIMLYLIQMGVESSLSFTIMEAVRKGKGLKPEWEEVMREHQVPEWYIESCNKIKYMFPKAHAAAYVMMAWRVAYYKIYYPLAYYSAYFSIRAKAFSYEKMCLGKARCEEHIRAIKKALGKDAEDDGPEKENNGDDEPEEKSSSGKDKDVLSDLQIVQEMYARGFEFTPVDLYQAGARDFRIVDGKIMPAFTAIDGLGDKNAELIEFEAKKGRFLSKEDFAKRTQTSKTTMETLTRLGILKGMTESNQLSLFDLCEE